MLRDESNSTLVKAFALHVAFPDSTVGTRVIISGTATIKQHHILRLLHDACRAVLIKYPPLVLGKLR